jgi:hypothetical protein
MKAKEFASLLRKVSEVLDNFDEEPIESVLDEIVKFSKSRKVKVNPKQSKVQVSNQNNEDFHLLIEEIRNLQQKKVSDFIKNSPSLKSKPQLLALAKELSIATSSRSTKESLIYAIIKYFERDKLDEIISKK